MKEPVITINGEQLTDAQAMSVRVAITNFHSETADMHALGTDEHGVKMCTLYHLRLSEVLGLVLKQSLTEQRGMTK
jgi:hypothetical protein